MLGLLLFAAIGSGSRVLVIGDSHVVGAYGDELDRLLRVRGCIVRTVGSSGATASSYLSGLGTRAGYVDHKRDGRVERVDVHDTPKLEDLVAQENPDTLVVCLGANFRNAPVEIMHRQVEQLGKIARAHRLTLIWVGPPLTRRDQDGTNRLPRFDSDLESQVRAYGRYLSSAPFTSKYAGRDGIHYNGPAGRKWAQGVVSRL